MTWEKGKSFQLRATFKCNCRFVLHQRLMINFLLGLSDKRQPSIMHSNFHFGASCGEKPNMHARRFYLAKIALKSRPLFACFKLE